MYIFNYIYLSIYIYLCFACLFSCCCRFTAARRRAIKYAGRLYWGQRYARGPACGGRPAGDPHLREQQAPGTATAAEERVNDANKLLRTEELWSMEQMSLSCSSGWMFIQDQTLRPAFNLTVFLIWLCSSTIYLLQHYFGSFLAMVNIFVRTCFFLVKHAVMISLHMLDYIASRMFVCSCAITIFQLPSQKLGIFGPIIDS